MKEMVFCCSMAGIAKCIPEHIKHRIKDGMDIREIRQDPELIQYAWDHEDCGLYVAEIGDNEHYVVITTGNVEFVLVSEGNICCPEHSREDFKDVLSHVDFHLSY